MSFLHYYLSHCTLSPVQSSKLSRVVFMVWSDRPRPAVAHVRRAEERGTAQAKVVAYLFIKHRRAARRPSALNDLVNNERAANGPSSGQQRLSPAAAASTDAKFDACRRDRNAVTNMFYARPNGQRHLCATRVQLTVITGYPSFVNK